MTDYAEWLRGFYLIQYPLNRFLGMGVKEKYATWIFIRQNETSHLSVIAKHKGF
jgi:hypothetical protein